MDQAKVLNSILTNPDRALEEHYNAGFDGTAVDLDEAVSILESTDALMHTNPSFVAEIQKAEQNFHRPHFAAMRASPRSDDARLQDR